MPELLLIGLVALLVVFTLVVAADPSVAPAVLNERLDLAISTSGALVAGAVALLAWGRFRESGDRRALLHASAFLSLATVNAAFLVSVLVDGGTSLRATLADPGPAPLFVSVLGRGLASVLLLVAGSAALRPAPIRPPSATTLLVAPTAIVLAAVAWSLLLPDAVPHLISDSWIEQLQRTPTEPLLPTGRSILLVALQVISAAAFLGGALLAYLAYRRDERGFDAALCGALIIAGFSQLHAAIHPGAYSPLVSTADLLRLAFYAVLLAAFAVAARTDVRELRVAHADLQRLHEADVARATQEERARVAREIHDGLSQDLWYAKLKQGRLLQTDGVAGEAHELATEVATALDAALAEARQAVMALRVDEAGAFDEVLRRFVEDFADRFAIRTECEVPREIGELRPRQQAELLRIVQEALNNVRRHADATVARVRVQLDAEGLRLTVSDNGRGFDPSATAAGGFGLESMRQRAALIGARLEIDSASRDGTRIHVLLPRRAAPERAP